MVLPSFVFSPSVQQGYGVAMGRKVELNYVIVLDFYVAVGTCTFSISSDTTHGDDSGKHTQSV